MAEDDKDYALILDFCKVSESLNGEYSQAPYRNQHWQDGDVRYWIRYNDRVDQGIARGQNYQAFPIWHQKQPYPLDILAGRPGGWQMDFLPNKEEGAAASTLSCYFLDGYGQPIEGLEVKVTQTDTGTREHVISLRDYIIANHPKLATSPPGSRGIIDMLAKRLEPDPYDQDMPVLQVKTDQDGKIPPIGLGREKRIAIEILNWQNSWSTILHDFSDYLRGYAWPLKLNAYSGLVKVPGAMTLIEHKWGDPRPTAKVTLPPPPPSAPLDMGKVVIEARNRAKDLHEAIQNFDHALENKVVAVKKYLLDNHGISDNPHPKLVSAALEATAHLDPLIAQARQKLRDLLNQQGARSNPANPLYDEAGSIIQHYIEHAINGFMQNRADSEKKNGERLPKPNKTTPFSIGCCGRYVHVAIKAGGQGKNHLLLGSPGKSADKKYHAYAKDFGGPLVAIGYQRWLTKKEYDNNPDGYIPLAGDVVVINHPGDVGPLPPDDLSPHSIGTGAGHIAIYDGSYWISDFQQMTKHNYPWYPGKSYDKGNPDFIIYRYIKE